MYDAPQQGSALREAGERIARMRSMRDAWWKHLSRADSSRCDRGWATLQRLQSARLTNKQKLSVNCVRAEMLYDVGLVGLDKHACRLICFASSFHGRRAGCQVISDLHLSDSRYGWRACQGLRQPLDS